MIYDSKAPLLLWFGGGPNPNGNEEEEVGGVRRPSPPRAR